jgi:hypothetical protein
MKQIWTLLIGILLFSVVVSAESWSNPYDTTITERSNIIGYWETNPCLYSIQNNTNLNIKVYPINCAFVHYHYIFQNRYYLRCDNTEIKIIVAYGSAQVQETNWTVVGKPKICTISAPVECNPEINAVYTPIPQQAPWSVFSATYPGEAYNFEYWESGTNETFNGFVNRTFNLNKTGDYSIKIYVRDHDNATVMPWATTLINYTVVAVNGNVPGDCTASSKLVSPGSTKNPITDIFGDWQEMIWYLLMVLVGGVILYVGNEMGIGIGVLVMVELLMVIVGAYLHIISPIIMLLVGVGIAAIIAIKVRQAFS